MSEYTLYPKVKPTGELPPKVLDRLDERYVNHDEWSRTSASAVSVADYGAKPGATASQSAAFQSAVDAAASAGVPVTVPVGVWTMTSTLRLPAGTSLHMEKGAVLDWSASSATLYLDVRGTVGTEVSLSAPIVRGARSIPWSGDALQAGDWVIIRSADIFDPDSTGVGHGELIQIRAVEAGVVHLMTPMCDDYRSDVRLTPVSMVSNVEVSGGTIRGNRVAGSGRTGVRVQYTDGLRLNGVRFEDIDDCHVSIRDSVDAWVSWCEFEWAESNAMGYAMSFADTTRDSGCLWGTFRGVRHTLSTNLSLIHI